jgi:molybdenum-dependent DNA-binding transcriptional regulator ModE
MVDAFRLAQIQALSDYPLPVEPAHLLADCKTGLEAIVHSGSLAYPAQYRLPFRELGLAIGLHALAGFRNLVEKSPGGLSQAGASGTALEGLQRFARLASEIEEFWLQPAQRHVATWRDHLDINSVMLATSLAPDTYLNVIPSELASRRHSK